MALIHLCKQCRRFVQEEEERLKSRRWSKVSTSWNHNFQGTYQKYWIHDIRKKVQKSLRSELCKCHLVLNYLCECEEIDEKEKVHWHNFFPEIVTNIKNNQVNACSMRNTRGKSDVICCWLNQKPSNAQLINLEQCLPFMWRSEQKTIEDISAYICYLVDKDQVL